MAYQLGALGAIKTPELVKMSKPTSGNYSQLFGQMNRNQEALGQREDRATLNALGSARAEAIMGGQAGSAALQGIRDAQAKALEAQDVPLYDKLTGDLKAQMQIESAEAKADPLGKNQLARDESERNALYRQQQLEAKNNANLGTPKIAEYIGLQTDAIENAENVLQSYLAIQNPTSEQKEEARVTYGKAWRANREAMAKLGGHAKATGQDYTKLPTWGKALKDGITYSSADELNKSLIDQAKSRANLLKAQESDVYGEIKRKKTKFDSEITSRNEENIRKALSDQKLAHPDVYAGYMEDAKTAYKLNNIYAMVKLLANTIEPGMNVADTEVEGYLQGGENRLSKLLFSVVGAGEKDKDKLLNLITGMGTNRMGRAQKILDGNSDKPIKKKKSNSNSKLTLRERYENRKKK